MINPEYRQNHQIKSQIHSFWLQLPSNSDFVTVAASPLKAMTPFKYSPFNLR